MIKYQRNNQSHLNKKHHQNKLAADKKLIIEQKCFKCKNYDVLKFQQHSAS